MSKGLKTILFGSLGFPMIVTILRIMIDYLLERNIDLFSYSAIFLGTATAGLIFVGPLNYYISKSPLALHKYSLIILTNTFY